VLVEEKVVVVKRAVEKVVGIKERVVGVSDRVGLGLGVVWVKLVVVGVVDEIKMKVVEVMGVKVVEGVTAKVVVALEALLDPKHESHVPTHVRERVAVPLPHVMFVSHVHTVHAVHTRGKPAEVSNNSLTHAW
jgi:hypothetical protein